MPDVLPATPRRSLGIVFLLFSALVATLRAESAEMPRALLLFSHDRLLPANLEIEQGFREALKDHSPQIEVFTEFLDVARFPDEGQAEAMTRYLAERYSIHPPDIIVGIGPQTYRFLAAHRDRLFPLTPLVVGATDEPTLRENPLIPDAAGRPVVWTTVPIFRDLPRFRPQIQRLHIVAGDSPFDRERLNQTLQAAGETGGPLEVTVATSKDLDSLLHEVANLPVDSAILYLSYFRGPDGVTTVPRDVGNALAKAASVPVLGMADTYLGDGMLGVCASPFREEGRFAAGLTRRILNGERPESIGILPTAEPRFIFDDRQLRRWKWDNLPPGSEIRYQEAGLWDAHRNTVLGGGALLFIQSGLIGGLMLARRRQKRSETQLRRSEARFSGIFHGSPSAIAILRSSDGTLVDLNPAWEAITGRSRQESLGRTPPELGFAIEGDARERLRAFLESGKPLREYEQRILATDGTESLLSLSTEAIELHGEACHVLMATDITDREEVDEARRQLAQSSRLAMLGEMTATIAHEVNQPLGAILSNAEAAEMLLARPDPPLDSVREILADICRDDRRASEVIQRVRGLIRRGKTRIELVDIPSLLRQTAALLEDVFRRHGVALEYEIRDDLPPVHADRGQLEQLLINLMMNATEAMLEEPVAHRIITLKADRRKDDRILLTVSDCGPGIDPEHGDQLFQSFFSTKADGMGLGLALARSIAEVHGGTMRAENNPSGGADFHLELPVTSVLAP